MAKIKVFGFILAAVLAGEAFAAGARSLRICLVDRCRPNAGAMVTSDFPMVLTKAGHAPYMIPYMTDRALIDRVLEPADLVFLTGGEDINPKLYGEEKGPKTGAANERRDGFDWMVLEEAVKLGKPIFGVCRGCQMINAFFGGTLIQDIPSEVKDPVIHTAKDAADHGIRVVEGSRLAKIFPEGIDSAKSWHHQSVEKVAPGFRATGFAADGVIEAIESEKGPIAAVQFHPETNVARDPGSHLIRFYEQLAVFIGIE